MAINIGIMGSCVSRDSFNSNFNKNYSDFFNIKLSAGRISLISLMSKPLFVDDTKINILPKSKENIFRMKCLKTDFEKKVLEDLINTDIEYLIIDNYFEVVFGIIFLNNQIITNNFWDIKDTEFANENTFHTLQIFDNPKEYFNLWVDSCNKFFKYMKKYCPEIKIILNPVKLAFHAINSDGTIDKNRYLDKATEFNKYLSMLDTYIVENFDVYIMKDYDNLLADDNHLWGSGEVHFQKDYYTKFLENLKLIIQKDYYLKNKPNPFKKKYSKQDVCSLIESLNNYERENFILKNDIKFNINKINLNSEKNEKIDFTNASKVILKNFIFSKPDEFICPSSLDVSSIKLVNLTQNIILIISIYGRFGNFCENDFQTMIKSNENNGIKIISTNIFKRNNVKFYNMLLAKEEFYESIYLVYKNNKTFRLTFAIYDTSINTLDIVEKIYNTLEEN